MASRHRSTPRLALDGHTVTEQDGASRTDMSGGLTLTETPAAPDTAATLEISVDPAAATDRAMRVDLSDQDVAALADALAAVRDDG